MLRVRNWGSADRHICVPDCFHFEYISAVTDLVELRVHLIQETDHRQRCQTTADRRETNDISEQYLPKYTTFTGFMIKIRMKIPVS